MLLRIEIKATERNDNDFWIAQDTVIVAKVKDYAKTSLFERWRLCSIPDFVEDTVGSSDAVLSKGCDGSLRLSLSVKEDDESDSTGLEFKVHKVSVVTDFPIP